MFNKLSSEKKPSNVIRQILNAIEGGQLKESDKLPNEPELAREFGVSRSVVREAMSSLVTMGIVKRIPGSGTFVQSVGDFKNMRTLNNDVVVWDHLEEIEKVGGSYDAYLARLLIEPVIAEYTAYRINNRDLKALGLQFDKMKYAAANKNMVDYQIEDLNFHLKLAKASGNKVLYKIFKEIMELIGFNFWDANRIWPEDSDGIQRSLNDHQDILAFIAEGKPSLVRNKMWEHLRAAFGEHKKLE